MKDCFTGCPIKVQLRSCWPRRYYHGTSEHFYLFKSQLSSKSLEKKPRSFESNIEVPPNVPICLKELWKLSKAVCQEEIITGCQNVFEEISET